MSSQEGSRSMRASKRYSVTALYLSMNANQRDLEIEDDLARGEPQYVRLVSGWARLTLFSSKSTARAEVTDILTVQEELRTGEGRAIPRLTDSTACAESNGVRRSTSLCRNDLRR